MRAGVRIGVVIAALALLVFGVTAFAGQAVSDAASSPGGAFIQASGSGAPWVRFQEEGLASTGRGEAKGAGVGRPLSMVSLDVNGDGVPDVVAGYAGGDGGVLKVFPGNPASLSPSGPAVRKGASKAPLFAATASVNVPVSPDFLAAGNVCPGGKAGVVFGSNGGTRLEFFGLDGKGSLVPAGEVDLGGPLTALAAGDLNRPDGVSSVAAGVNGSKGPQVVVFHGKLSPDASVAMPQTVTALGMGRLGSGAFSDLAVAAGDTLVVVQGRDRFMPQSAGAKAPAAVTDSRSFGSGIVSLAVGPFSAGKLNSVALLLQDGTVQVVTPGYDKAAVREAVTKQQTLVPSKLSTWSLDTKGSYSGATQIMGARISSRPGGEDLVVVSPSERRVYVVEGQKRQAPGQSSAVSPDPVTEKLRLSEEPGAVLAMRLGASALDGLVVMKKSTGRPVAEVTPAGTIFWVTDTGDSGPGTLRQAILDANANPGMDTIDFNIPEGSFAGTPVITPMTPLPQVTDPVIIDGTSQWSYAWGAIGNGVVEIDGSFVDLVFDVTAGSSTIAGLEIEGGLAGIQFSVNGGNVASAIFTGYGGYASNRKEAIGGGNEVGILVLDCPFNSIGGTSPDQACVISGNGVGIVIYGDKAVQNSVYGNFIGTDSTGQYPNGNYLAGVLVVLAETNQIGAAASTARNIISGNGLYGGNQPSSADIGNDLGMGVLILGAGLDNEVPSLPPITVMPKTAHPASLPSPQSFFARLNTLKPGKSQLNCIGFDDGFSLGNFVQGNYIGTDVYGSSAVPNATEGVAVGASFYTTVGGGTPARNVISGNGDFGVAAIGALGFKVQGNFIGPAWDGENTITYDGQSYYTGNASGGVVLSDIWVSDGCPYTILPTIAEIGGTDPGEGNVISGNYGDGIDWFGTPPCEAAPQPTAAKSRAESSFVYNAIVGNFIGTDATGRFALGNWFDGIFSAFTGSGNGILIGGWDPTMRNVISGNGFYDYRKHGGASKAKQGKTARHEDGISEDGWGIEMYYGDGSGIFGNYIGTDVTGAYTAIPNSYGGIYLDDTWGVDVGDYSELPAPPARKGPVRRETASSPLDSGGNLISGNYGDGLYMYSCQFAGIYNNYVGTDVTGTQEGWGNDGEGVYLEDCNPYLFGGANRQAAPHGAPHAMRANGSSWAGAFQSRAVGVSPKAKSRSEDGASYGIDVMYNLLSGNSDDGIELDGTGFTYVGYNFMGTDMSGTMALGNGDNGADDYYGYANTFDSNLISANGAEEGASGVYLDDDCEEYDYYDQFIYNTIGADITGTQDLHNYGDGIYVANGASNWIAWNLIAFNQGAGVYLDEYCYDFYNQISQNSIFNNTDAGITLAYQDTNDGIPYPWINQAITNGVNTLVLGNWVANWSPGGVTMEYFTNDECGPPSGDLAPKLRANPHGQEIVASGYGQGKYYQSSDQPGTDPSGYFASLLGPLDPGSILTSTATADYYYGGGAAHPAKGPARQARKEDASNPIDTSQFSNCIDVVSCPTITVGVACPGGASNIDTTPSWNGTGEITCFPATKTYGQTITAPGSGTVNLYDWTVYVNTSAGVLFRGYVYAWDSVNHVVTGSALYTSGDTHTSGSGNPEAITFNTGALALTGGSQYVLFISVMDTTSSGSGECGSMAAIWGGSAYSGGDFVYADNYASGWSGPWDWSTADLSFKADFCPPLSGVANTAFNTVTFGASGGQGPYIYSYTGTLPPGLSLDPVTGALAGTPTDAGDFTFTITAKDTNGGLIPDGFCFGTGTFTIHVAWPPIACAGIISPATPISATAGTPVTYSVGSVTGGDGGPYTYSWNLGGLPPNNLQTGSSVTQTYMANGTFTVTLTVTDNHGNTCTDTAQVTVSGGGPYDMFFKDLYGRSTMCANSTTGAYVFNILTGLGAGFGYTGTAIVTSSLGGVINLNTPVSDPNRVQMTWVIAQDKANGSFANGLVPAKQVLSDITVSANTSAICNPFTPSVPPPQK